MEALAFHPAGKLFLMAGRLFQGTWNLALFDAASGKNVFSTDAKHRITDARFSPDGGRLFLAKARQQELKDGKWAEFGLVEVHSVTG
jgi:WD40 repeat protein